MDVVIAQNMMLSAACFFVLWTIAVRLRDVSFIDSWWALGIVMLAAVTWWRGGNGGLHALLLFGLTTAWGLRLGLYLLWRWRAYGPDRRYQRILGRARNDKRWSFARASFQQVFALQAVLQFIVFLPVQIGLLTDDGRALGPVAIVGAALAVFGILFESTADLQLLLFKRDKENHGRVLDSGLWRYTRHPNYFGDACVWWGLFLIAAETPYGLWTVGGPVLITALLTRWSGVPTVEEPMRRKRPDYAAYIARTSTFVPWPPKEAA